MAFPSRLWHFLLTCILLIVLPIQGVAQAGMMACRIQHHAHMQASVAHHTQTMEGHRAAIHHDLSGHAGSGEGKSFAKPTSIKCSQCAPCHIGAALLFEPVFVTVDAAGAQAFPPLAVLSISVEHDGIDRPPRTLLVG